MSYKLVTFDVTNTLLKFSSNSGVQYAKVAALYGVKTDPNKLTTAFRSEWKTMNRDHPNFGAKSGLGSKRWWTSVVDQTFRNSGYNVNEDNMKRISDHLIEVYGTIACWDVRPGVIDALNYLRKSHSSLCVGVISNFDERLHKILVETQLRPYFDFVLASYNCGFYKPQKEIFQMALDVKKCNPAEAVHVGDDFELDYLAAKNAGWNAVLYCEDAKNQKINKISHEYPNIIYDIREIKGIV